MFFNIWLNECVLYLPKMFNNSFQVMSNSWFGKLCMYNWLHHKTKVPCNQRTMEHTFKPQYTLMKSHHWIPSSILSGNSSFTLWHHAYFSRVCLKLVPGFNTFILCAMEYVLCDWIRKMCGCGIDNQFDFGSPSHLLIVTLIV